MLYFAIDAQCRSQGYGSRIIAELERQYPSDTIVLDIRTPDANAADAQQRQKRLDFYLRNGFHIAPFEWVEAAERYTVLYSRSTQPYTALARLAVLLVLSAARRLV